MNKHYHSVFYNEQDCLKAILALHIKKDTFDLDPMFYKGGFYKEIPIPNKISDIRAYELESKTIDTKDNPLYCWDATNLPLEDNSLNSIILDPPFVIANRPSNFRNITTNFGSFKSEKELKDFYFKILTEAARILRKKGICVFKCQDFTDSKTIISHVVVANWAELNGFYIKDLAILVNPRNKPTNNKLNQRHFRKIHTYFWVLEKIK